MNLTLCLTRNCNLRCSYCYAGDKKSESMPWETARAGMDFAVQGALDEASRRNTPPRLTMGFFGGEPLLEWDLLRNCHDYITEKASTVGIQLKYTLTTNMTLLDREKADWLQERSYFLGLSLDGNEAMHNSCRRYAGGRGSHADSRRALEYFHTLDSHAEIIMVIDPSNVTHLADSVRWLSENSPLKIMFNPNFSARWTDKDLENLSEQYEKAAEIYVEKYREDAPIYINIIDGKIKTHLLGGYKDCDKCSFGEKEIAVSISGNFYPCARLVGNDDTPELIFGNVFDGYDEAKRMRLILNRGNRNEACRECTLKDRCMNWCGCVNYVTSNGDFGRAGEFTCFHERLSIRISDSVAERLWDEKNPHFLKRHYGISIG